MTLLAKTRTLNKLLQRAAGKAVNFREMSEVLRDTIEANVYVVNRNGKVLGYAVTDEIGLRALQQETADEIRFTAELTHLLLKIEETASNIEQEHLNNPFIQEISSIFSHSIITIIPINGGGDRLGTIVLTRGVKPFIDDDLILAEYGSTIVAMELLRVRSEEREYEVRSKTAVLAAVNSLSYSEMEAVEHIIPELKDNEGLLVASKIADRAGITRSVIVNALRKLEGAGVIETRSLGMKGTYIKILNDQLVNHIRR
ncbi:transcriptional repressor CodY [Paenibacillus selenitireducens]|uniref:Global transcriptional regulator CodY n=1 Tax=Paenibacillus selenitireducens TaxID=1324314 RepID=A0A1T2XCN2_9BACL|nr:GTP-sensing pleiotropic transcriptional regulator CodY [Paenibacillus selenitireducens]OPA77588.1 transcriptional repressor CodY [Paenibacillus selenitireducens]